MSAAAASVGTVMHDGRPLVSVVVNNYNYARFVGRAISSALEQTYPHVEVVVVDDGSTDGSRDVIEVFGERIVTVLKQNGGQGSAFNAGFERTTGAIVMYLDSDDYLFPDAVARIVAAFREGAAKTQHRLVVVDGDERELGQYPPAGMPLDAGDVTGRLLERGHYATAVTSGNAYRRTVLARILPVPEAEFRYCADGYVNVLAPFEGDVVAIEEPLGAYRVHDGSFSAIGAGVDVERFRFYIRHHLELERLAREAATRAGLQPRPGALLRYPGHLESRLASLRLEPARHPVPGDRRWQLVRCGIVASWRYTDTSAVRRVADTAWFALVGILPRDAARSVVGWKYVRSSRPRWLRWVVRGVRRLIG